MTSDDPGTWVVPARKVAMVYARKLGLAAHDPRRDDLAQAALVRIWECSRRFDTTYGTDFGLWSIRQAKQACADWWRTQSHPCGWCLRGRDDRPAVLGDLLLTRVTAEPDETSAADERCEEIATNLRLGQRSREMFRSHYLDGQTFEEIGARHSVSSTRIGHLIGGLKKVNEEDTLPGAAVNAQSVGQINEVRLVARQLGLPLFAGRLRPGDAAKVETVLRKRRAEKQSRQTRTKGAK